MTQVTIEQALQTAIERHLAGQLPQAEQLYRQILAQHPNHPDALHNLGMLANQVGRTDAALHLLRRAVAVNPSAAIYCVHLASILIPAGQLDEAVTILRRAIQLAPFDSEAQNHLGIALAALGRPEEAIVAFTEAARLQPEFAQARNNLGNALRSCGRLDEAIAAYNEAIARNPDFAEAHHNLGLALHKLDPRDEAIAAHRRAIELKPDFAHAHYHLGEAWIAQRRYDDAIAAYTRALAAKPDYAEAHERLGCAAYAKGDVEDAIVAFRRAIQINPNFADAYTNLGGALVALDRLDEAVDALNTAIKLQPANVGAYNNLANALTFLGRMTEAIDAFNAAIRIQPDFVEAHNNLGNVYRNFAQIDQAIACYDRAIELDPDFAMAHSDRVFGLLFHPDHDARANRDESRRWNQRHAEPLRHLIRPHDNDRDPDRPLRIGYLSPDFRDHSVGRNILPLFREHDAAHFQVFCYSHTMHRDPMTERFQHLAQWRHIVPLTDEQAAELIRADQIDILVDLALHTGNNRLPVFARKPAPIQVTFAGYPGSTGLETIDYRLTDSYLDPPGSDDSLYSEKSIRLPHSFWCYDPAAMEADEVPVGPLPVLSSGHVTFGCLNNFCKVNDRVFDLWSSVLAAVPESHFLLLAAPGEIRQRTIDLFAARGIDSQRLEFIDFLPRIQYLHAYDRIDIGLDTFPYNGHTTSLDSYWMGVPVLTLIGKTIVGRAGWSQLSNLNLTELAADTPDALLRLARDLAGDLPRLGKLRRGLRQRMLESPLTDARQFTRGIEAAYRDMWHRWCRPTADQ